MIFGFFKKLIKYYIDKLVDWMRMVKFDIELENQIKKCKPNKSKLHSRFREA